MPNRFIKIIAFFLCFLLIFEQSGFAQIAGELDISSHLLALRNSLSQDKFRPLHLRYLSYDSINNNFKLLLDKGSTFQATAEGDTFRKSYQVTLKRKVSPSDSMKVSPGIPWDEAKLKEETKLLLNYFFIGLTLPNDTFWVNLRPDSPDNIIDEALAKTDIGRILLEADLQLKKDTASFTSPQTPEGKLYWDKLYKKAEELFGYENITIPTLTRPWIVPGEIIIRETADEPVSQLASLPVSQFDRQPANPSTSLGAGRPTGKLSSAYIYKATLKVMLESEYLKGEGSRVKGQGEPLSLEPTAYSFSDPRLKALNEYSTQLIRELIIPKLTKDVNTSKRYAPLRQVYYSLILAQWFKARYRAETAGDTFQASAEGDTFRQGYQETIERKVSPTVITLIDTKDLTNLTSKTPYSKDTYFNEYKRSFAEGEYNLKEPVYTPYGQSIRSYMSGGVNLEPLVSSAITIAGNNRNPVAIFGAGASLANHNILASFQGGPETVDLKIEKKEQLLANVARYREFNPSFIEASKKPAQQEVKEGVSNLPKTSASSLADEGSGLGKCVTADTLLTLADGRQIPILKIKSGDYVLSLNEETGRIEPHRVKGLLDMGVKPVYKLITSTGRSIKTTGNHPYLVKLEARSSKFEGGVIASAEGAKQSQEIASSATSWPPRNDKTEGVSEVEVGKLESQWRKVVELKIGDKIVCLVDTKTLLNREWVERRKQTFFSSIKQAGPCVSAYENRTKRLQAKAGGKDNSVVTGKMMLKNQVIGFKKGFSANVQNGNSLYPDIRIKSFYSLLEIFNSNFLFPQVFINRRSEFRNGERANYDVRRFFRKEPIQYPSSFFIAVPFNQSACIQKIEHLSLFFFPELRDSISKAAFYLGKAFSNFSQRRRFSGNPFFRNVFTSRSYRQSFANELLDCNVVDLSHNLVSFCIKDNILLNSLSRLFLPEPVEAAQVIETTAKSDIFWDKIISIEPLGFEHVYDIEVEGTHNFIGNGIFAHNTYIGAASPLGQGQEERNIASPKNGKGWVLGIGRVTAAATMLIAALLFNPLRIAEEIKIEQPQKVKTQKDTADVKIEKRIDSVTNYVLHKTPKAAKQAFRETIKDVKQYMPYLAEHVSETDLRIIAGIEDELGSIESRSSKNALGPMQIREITFKDLLLFIDALEKKVKKGTASKEKLDQYRFFKKIKDRYKQYLKLPWEEAVKKIGIKGNYELGAGVHIKNLIVVGKMRASNPELSKVPIEHLLVVAYNAGPSWVFRWAELPLDTNHYLKIRNEVRKRIAEITKISKPQTSSSSLFEAKEEFSASPLPELNASSAVEKKISSYDTATFISPGTEVIGYIVMPDGRRLNMRVGKDDKKRQISVVFFDENDKQIGFVNVYNIHYLINYAYVQKAERGKGYSTAMIGAVLKGLKEGRLTGQEQTYFTMYLRNPLLGETITDYGFVPNLNYAPELITKVLISKTKNMNNKFPLYIEDPIKKKNIENYINDEPYWQENFEVVLDKPQDGKEVYIFTAYSQGNPDKINEKLSAEKISVSFEPPLAGSPVVSQVSADKGGIDLRALPIVREPVVSSSSPVLSPQLLAPSPVLDIEWQQIQRMLNAGIIPSGQRLVGYISSCLKDGVYIQESDKILGSVADILRIQEQRVEPTENGFSNLLVLLESDKPAPELELALTAIEFAAKEPKAIEP